MAGDKAEKATKSGKITSYERVRMETMKQNAERMEAKGLTLVASRLYKSTTIAECGKDIEEVSTSRNEENEV